LYDWLQECQVLLPLPKEELKTLSRLPFERCPHKVEHFQVQLWLDSILANTLFLHDGQAESTDETRVLQMESFPMLDKSWYICI
jgi:hypothetical protein